MKATRTIVVLIAVLFSISGCAYFDQVYKPPAPGDGLCDKVGPEGSVICQIMTRLQTTPEQYNDLLLDVSLVSMATKLTSEAELRASISKVRLWVVERDVLTMAGLLQWLSTEAAVDPYLSLMISRRLGALSIPGLNLQVFTAYDKMLIIKALDAQDAQLDWV